MSRNNQSTTWHLSLAYDGTNYYGFQVQPHVPTVHAEIEERLRKFFREPELRITAASRTDAGVHALDQHVSFDTASSDISGEQLTNALNKWLPMDIRVKWARPLSRCFHTRSSATAKSYVYMLYPGLRIPPFITNYCWQLNASLNTANMRAAARILTGEHDFSSFAVSRRQPVFSHRRTIHRLEIIPDVSGQTCIHVLGNGFLYKMVRSLVGYLVYVGRQRNWSPTDTDAVLAARDRSAAAKTAPPQGLFLAKVFFDQATWQHFEPPLPLCSRIPG